MFAVCVVSVPLYHFGHACVVLGVAVGRFFSGLTSGSGDIDCFNLEKHF